MVRRTARSRRAAAPAKRRRPYAFRPFRVEEVKYAKPPVPLERSGHRVACTHTALYSVGGYNPALEDPIYRQLWRFSLGRRRWKCFGGEIARSLPRELASSALCLSGRALMLFGGTGAPFGHRCCNRLYVKDVEAGDRPFVRIDAQGRAPEPQYGQAIFHHGGYLYSIGGTDGLLYSIDVHRLDLETSTWEAVFTSTGNRADEPEARYRHELAFDGADVYVLAGGTGDRAFDFVDVPIFNLDTCRWRFRRSTPDEKHGYPPPRKCHSAIQIQNDNDRIEAFIACGFDDGKIFNDVWKLTIPSLGWTLMTASVFPRPLYFHSSAVTPQGCMYTFGGIYSIRHELQSRTDKMYKMWLCIPKLSEICWESLLHNYPTFADTESSELLSIGVPRRFVERLEL